MSKTYTLHPTAIVHGKLISTSLWGNDYSNLSYASGQIIAGMDGSLVPDYYNPSVYIWDEMNCVNFMFDQTTLALLRTKTIQSVTFKTKVSGTLKSKDADSRHQIRYKYNSTPGTTASSASPYWTSAADANSSATGTAVAGRIGSSTSSDQSVSNQEISVSLNRSIPKYGYVVGPANVYSEYKGLLSFSGTLTDTALIVVTDEIEDFSVVYSANGGEGAPPAQTYPVGSSVTLSNVTPTRAGYQFLGWSQDSTASAASYAPGSTQTFNANVTLYAVWALLTYTITFDANGGNNAPSPQTKTHGVDLTLASDVPTREGYAFEGWATSNVAVAADYDPGDTYSLDGNATLYAVWSVVTAEHTLSYNANGGTGAPASETQTYSVLSPTFFTVSSAQPTRTGHTFKGWSSTSSGSVEYSAGDHIPASADKTLYAVWQINTFQVSFNANGGSGAPSAQTKTYGVDLTLSSTVPTRTGYNFLGWAESVGATEAAYQAGGTYTKNQSKTLYAVWQLKTYTVSFNASGGRNAPANQTKTHGQTLVLSSQIPTKAGYLFCGWGLTSGTNIVAYEAGANYTDNAAITLYAVWRQIAPSGVYVMRNGELVPVIVYV